jgi:hypothetical protein
MRGTFCLAIVLLGCGHASSSPTKGSTGGAEKALSVLADESCPGFTLVGLQYSPGGDVLPHTCKPFDPMTNNPYAVRCVDTIPGFQTKFPGDEFCILPPPPDKGTQIGAHPQGEANYWDKMYAGDFSDYSNSELTKPYEMAPGTEVVQNYYTTATNADAHHYFRIDTRMRPGSHHLVSWLPRGPMTQGWAPLSDQSLLNGAPLYNVQSTHSDRPSAMDTAPEDQGLGMSFAANPPVALQFHHINAQNAPMLREAWINLWWLPDSQMVTPVQTQAFVAAIDYPPGQVTDNVQTVKATADTRIVSVFGHRHAWTTRFSTQLTRADGTTTDFYESFSWLEMPTFELDSVTTNPAPGVDRATDGSISGEVTLHAGDSLTYTCHVETTPTEADKLGVPVPTANLKFGNEAYGAEMCVLYLETSGAALSSGQRTSLLPGQ